MKSLIFVLGSMIFTTAYACSTHTMIVNGRVVTCTTCCAGNNCTTNCY